MRWYGYPPSPNNRVFHRLSPLFLAIQRLKGTVPQLAYETHSNQMKLAYEALHESTGRQGRLRHVQCLKLGKWNLHRHPLSISPIPVDGTFHPVIKALKGLPTLDPVFVGPSSGSTQ